MIKILGPRNWGETTITKTTLIFCKFFWVIFFWVIFALGNFCLDCKWLEYMEKTYQEWLPAIPGVRWTYRIISCVYGTHLSKIACKGARKHHTTRPAHRHRPNGRVPLGG